MRQLLYIDLFCGAGGTSTGVNSARLDGEECAAVVSCVNHDPKAIESHAANHPGAMHFTEDIRTLDLSPLLAHLDTAIYMPSENFSDGWDKGSEYAIRSQWISVDERLPQDKEHIVICYQSYHKGRYLTLYMTDRYEKESGFNGGWIKPEQVIAWMPIPALSLRRTPNKNER